MTFCCVLLLISGGLSAKPLPLQLAKHYQDGIEIEHYLVSEKLDGVRGYWDTKQLLTRNGNVIAAPAWFIAQLPNKAVEGELWLGRGQFEEISALVRTKQSSQERWRQVKFMLFDAPNMPLPFKSRYQYLQQISQHSPNVKAITQRQFTDRDGLFDYFDKVVAHGGEGLMLHHQDAHYSVGRSPHIVKLKPKYDDEARVIGYTKGKGKYVGKVGALVVKHADGKIILLGSGLTDALRENPPRIGQLITYEYSGLTQSGMPRFARFKRVRNSL
ncbi:DNA ligase [Shewanella intestini]|uniref:DNA ligase n=2 Tax=Shewanella TaxID=22 RepID=A0ABS5I151_9GAMM|nr:DNA ligase [Shewanella intestini]MBR9727752.1 DNA ligase [Shewanella intestini]MRG36255.1 DNA ligase [Shewanella sp. XMDDZSB0408]